jgi:hypothetical protein
MFMDVNSIAAETQGIAYLQGHSEDFYLPDKATQELRTFDLPKSIWRTMLLAYFIFFVTITITTGRDRGALFMIAISAGYALMYFGTAAVINAVGARGRPANVAGDMDTATGKLSYPAAFAQVLTVPLAIALFGCVIAIIRALAVP